jgi:predicted nucleic acid-binding protein
MIIVDSSVWIAHLRGLDSPEVTALRALVDEDDDRILVGDLILLEVLQGARDEGRAAGIERDLREYAVAPMLNPELAIQAARNYRLLRGRGITVRKTIDTIIATFCLAGGHALLHADRDFDPMETHLGLRVVRPGTAISEAS